MFCPFAICAPTSLSHVHAWLISAGRRHAWYRTLSPIPQLQRDAWLLYHFIHLITSRLSGVCTGRVCIARLAYFTDVFMRREVRSPFLPSVVAHISFKLKKRGFQIAQASHAWAPPEWTATSHGFRNIPENMTCFIFSSLEKHLAQYCRASLSVVVPED